MSQPSSSPPADNNKANEPDFDHPGDWNDATGVGPVLRAPDGVKNAPLTGDLYVDLDGRLYFGARISMEEGTVWSPVPVEVSSQPVVRPPAAGVHAVFPWF